MASPSPYANKLFNNPDGSIYSFRVVAPTCQTASIDLDGDVDIFFDCEEWPWLESEPKDDFQNANGDRIPCSNSSESKGSMMGTGMSIEMALTMEMDTDTDTDTDIRMKMPMSNAMKNKTILSKNDFTRNFISGERKLSDFFHQYDFWNHLHINKDDALEHNNKGGLFIGDSYGVNQADDAGPRKKEIFHSLPTTTTRLRRQSKQKLHSSFTETIPLPPPPPQPHCGCAGCLPINWNRLLFRGSKKLKYLLKTSKPSSS